MALRFFLQNREKLEMEILTFYAIMFESVKVQKRSAPENDLLNIRFVKDTYVHAKKNG